MFQLNFNENFKINCETKKTKKYGKSEKETVDSFVKKSKTTYTMQTYVVLFRNL